MTSAASLMSGQTPLAVRMRPVSLDEVAGQQHLLRAGSPIVALADPVDGGVLWFSAPDKAVVEKFAAEDPYVKGGLVTKWTVRTWTTVVGDAATTPIRPDP